MTTAQEEDDESILDAVSAAKLKALETELWNAASALVFRTEERDDAKQEIVDLKSKLTETKIGLKSCKAEVERLEMENSLLLLRSDQTLGPGHTLEQAKEAMAALGTHNRQLTLSLWWACSALKLERERASGGDDSENGNYRSRHLSSTCAAHHHPGIKPLSNFQLTAFPCLIGWPISGMARWACTRGWPTTSSGRRSRKACWPTP